MNQSIIIGTLIGVLFATSVFFHAEKESWRIATYCALNDKYIDLTESNLIGYRRWTCEGDEEYINK